LTVKGKKGTLVSKKDLGSNSTSLREETTELEPKGRGRKRGKMNFRGKSNSQSSKILQRIRRNRGEEKEKEGGVFLPQRGKFHTEASRRRKKKGNEFIVLILGKKLLP